MKKILALLCTFLALPVCAQTTAFKAFVIANPAAAALGSSDLFPGVQGGANVKITAAQIATYVGANLGTLPCTSMPALSGTITTAGGTCVTTFTSTTGSGATVQATSPTLVTPALGIPSALVLTNATAIPYGVGGTGVVPMANIWQYGPATPATVPTATATTGGSLAISSAYFYTVTYVNALGESDFNTSALPCVTLSAAQNAVNLTAVPVSADATVTARKIYRSPGLTNCAQDPRGGWTSTSGATPASTTSTATSYRLLATIADNTTTTYADTTADTGLTASYPQGISTAIPNWNRASDPSGQRLVVAPYGNSIAMGQGALLTKTCYACAALGINSLTANTTGVRNSAIGTFALTANTSGSQNVAVGDHAIGLNTIQSNDTAVGYGALSHENYAGGLIVNPSTALGAYALYNQASTATNQGGNVGVGYQALMNDSTGGNNMGLGAFSLTGVSTGSSNVGVGAQAMQQLSTGSFNIAIGTTANSGVTGAAAGNVGVGYGTLATAMSANSNTALGFQNLKTVTGASNTGLGASVGSVTCGSGTGNVLIGTSSATDCFSATSSNQINIKGLIFYNTASLAAPAVSSCGTSPTIDANANNKSGTVTVGTVAAASCTITFAGSGYLQWNHCRVTSQSSIATFAYSYTKTVITVTGTSLIGDLIDYDCDGY